MKKQLQALLALSLLLIGSVVRPSDEVTPEPTIEQVVLDIVSPEVTIIDEEIALDATPTEELELPEDSSETEEQSAPEAQLEPAEETTISPEDAAKEQLFKTFMLRLATKTFMQAALGFVQEKFDLKGTKGKFDEFKMKDFAEPILVDYLADEFIGYDKDAQLDKSMEVAEWAVPALSGKLGALGGKCYYNAEKDSTKPANYSKRTDIKNNQFLQVKEIFHKLLADAIAKKKLFLPKDHEFRKTLENPLVSLTASLAAINKVGTKNLEFELEEVQDPAHPTDATKKIKVIKSIKETDLQGKLDTRDALNTLQTIGVTMFCEDLVSKVIAPRVYRIMGTESAVGAFFAEKECRKEALEALVSALLVASVMQWYVNANA